MKPATDQTRFFDTTDALVLATMVIWCLVCAALPYLCVRAGLL